MNRRNAMPQPGSTFFSSRVFQTSVLLALVTALPARAADREWSGGDGSWGTGANWVGGTAAGASDVAIFNGTDNNINQTITLDGNRTVQGLTFNNLGTTLINQGSSGALTVTNGGNSLITTGVGSGAVTIAPNSFFGTNNAGGNYVFNLNGGSLTYNGVVASVRTGARTWEVNGGTLNLAGGIRLNSSVGNSTTRSNTITGNGTLILAGGIDVDNAPLSTLLTDTGFTGILRLVNTSNNMTTRITHNGGTLQFANGVDPALGATGEIQWNGGKIAAHGGPQTVSSVLRYSANNTTLEFSGSNALTLTGDLIAGTTNQDANLMTLRVSNSALTTLDGDFIMNRSLNSGNRSRVIEVDSGSHFLVNGKLTVDHPDAAINLTVQGGGILELTNNNDYSNANVNGITTIESGTLLANNTSGSATGTGVITVNGGTLGGNGFIAGNVTVNAGGAINPGNSIGTLTLENNATFNNDSLFSIELGAGNSSDLLNVGGLLTLGSGSILNVITPAVGTFTIANYGSLSGTFGSVTGLSGFDYTLDYGTLNPDAITLTVIPEPGTLVLVGIALGSLMLFRRRR
jgi:fibronectin-binding autotransporter adhesin